MRIPENHFLLNTFIAHRGLWNQTFAENSILAYKNAIENGYAIEIDLFETKDKQIVCVHDANLSRLTGVNKFVWELTLKEIKELNILGTNQKIPTLLETLELCKNKAPLLIELKNQPSKTFVVSVVDILKDYNGEFAVQSFNPIYLSKIKRLAPNFLRGVLASNTPDTDKKLERFVVKRMPFNFLCKPHFISYEHTGLPLKNKKCLPVIAWTVKAQEEYEKIKPYANNIIFENFIPEK